MLASIAATLIASTASGGEAQEPTYTYFCMADHTFQQTFFVTSLFRASPEDTHRISAEWNAYLAAQGFEYLQSGCIPYQDADTAAGVRSRMMNSAREHEKQIRELDYAGH